MPPSRPVTTASQTVVTAGHGREALPTAAARMPTQPGTRRGSTVAPLRGMAAMLNQRWQVTQQAPRQAQLGPMPTSSWCIRVGVGQTSLAEQIQRWTRSKGRHSCSHWRHHPLRSPERTRVPSIRVLRTRPDQSEPTYPVACPLLTQHLTPCEVSRP